MQRNITRPTGSGPVVLIGVRDSERSHRALAWATDYAAEHGATIVAVHVTTHPRQFVRDLLSFNQSWRAGLRRSIRADWTAEARRRGVPVQCHVVEAGSVATGLLSVARAVRPDLIVVGAHRFPSLLQPILRQLRAHSWCSVQAVSPTWTLPGLAAPGQPVAVPAS